MGLLIMPELNRLAVERFLVGSSQNGNCLSRAQYLRQDKYNHRNV